MELKSSKNGAELTVKMVGRLDTSAASKVMEELDGMLTQGVEALVIDLAECDYVASSGLRVLLSAQKKMNSLQGTMVIKNVMSDIMEVIEMTGLSNILTVEEM